MIGAFARKSLDLIFTRAARNSLIVNPTDRIDIAPLPTGKFIDPPEQKFLVLTISSYTFRLLTMIHYSVTGETNHYFNPEGEKHDFDNRFGEIGNLCCGAMKREMGHHFMHLGLSTPFTLSNKCMPFLDVLKPALVSQHKIDINNSVTLHASLCLCAYADFDFNFDPRKHEEASGSLETLAGAIEFL